MARPDHFDSRHLLGVIFLQRGNPAQALNQINSALKLNPDNVAALNNRGIALQELKRFDEALETWSASTERNSQGEHRSKWLPTPAELKPLVIAAQRKREAAAREPAIASAPVSISTGNLAAQSNGPALLATAIVNGPAPEPIERLMGGAGLIASVDGSAITPPSAADRAVLLARPQAG